MLSAVVATLGQSHHSQGHHNAGRSSMARRETQPRLSGVPPALGTVDPRPHHNMLHEPAVRSRAEGGGGLGRTTQLHA